MTGTATSTGPLRGMRVLDCTHVIAGAWCSMLLADLGADVIKIEPPQGAVTRTSVGPFRPYDFINRNKRAIAVDLVTPDGVATLRRLAAWADVWVENFRPGALRATGRRAKRPYGSALAYLVSGGSRGQCGGRRVRDRARALGAP